MKILTAILLILFTPNVFANPSDSRKGFSTQGVRYQLVQLSEYRRDQYLVDTETGRVWVIVCSMFKEDKCVGIGKLVELEVEGLHPLRYPSKK